MGSIRRLLPILALLLFVTSPSYCAEIETHFAKFNDAKIRYLSTGKGDEALVFVHGWTCNADFWRPQLSDFPGMHVIAVDLIGHGQSDKPKVPYTMDLFARSIEAALADAKVKRALLVGHSMGTPVVRQFYRLYPEKTAGLVIVDGALRLFASKEQMDQMLAPLRADYQAQVPKMVEGILGPLKDEKLRGEIKTAMLSTPSYVGLSAFEGMTDPAVYAKDAIKVPLLAILAKSPIWQPDTEDFLRSLAPQLDYKMWDGVSHFLMMERPKEFDQEVQAFLTKYKLLGK
jgi:pimeloyl-ACP methyl ester carboxylesterase